MEQLLKTFSDLHHAAGGVYQRVQQACDPLAGSSMFMLDNLKQQHQSNKRNPKQVHFKAPFASIASSFGPGSSSAGRTGRSDKQSDNKKDRQDQEEERILISEVGCGQC